MNLLRRIFSRKQTAPSRPLRIVTDAEGLRIVSGPGEDADVSQSLRWDEVTVVGAYRKDCYGFDLCCVELLSQSSAAILIHEQNEGFVDACFAITKNLAIRDEEWVVALLARPAFDTSITFVYQRPAPDEANAKPASS